MRVPAASTPSRRRRLGLLMLLAASLASGCRDAPTAAAPPPAPVQVAAVVQKDVPIYGEWVGTMVGYVTAQIRARVSGYVVSQDYKEGALVEAGDLLFEIDPRPYRLAVEQARAQLQLAKAQLEQAKAQVAQAEAQVAQAEANQRRTQLDVARYGPLASRGSVSQQELDNAVQNNLANVAAVKAARATLANARAGVPRMQATIAQMQAVLDNAELDLGWTKVFSPIDGIAGIKNVDIGDLVGASTTLTTVSRVDPIYVQFPVSEQEYLRWVQHGPQAGSNDARRRLVLGARRIREGPPELGRPSAPSENLEVTLADGTTYPHRGTAVILDREVDATTGTIDVRGVIPNPGGLLRPGQFARVRAVIDLKTGALLVPQRAVQDVQGLRRVAVVRPDDTVDLRKVEVGDRIGALYVIERGLEPGERVVVEGIEKVRAGDKVAPSEGTPPAGAPSS